jgi:hypothetical protein
MQELSLQSPMADDLMAQAEVDARIEKAKAATAKYMAYRKAAREGTLTYEQFMQMAPATRNQYAAMFGRPRSPDQVVNKAKQKAKRTRARKVANASRARNRKAK